MINKILDKFPEFNNNWNTELRIQWLISYSDLIKNLNVDKSDNTVLGFDTKDST